MPTRRFRNTMKRFTRLIDRNIDARMAEIAEVRKKHAEETRPTLNAADLPYCSECGQQGEFQFCSNCGAVLSRANR